MHSFGNRDAKLVCLLEAARSTKVCQAKCIIEPNNLSLFYSQQGIYISDELAEQHNWNVELKK